MSNKSLANTAKGLYEYMLEKDTDAIHFTIAKVKPKLILESNKADSVLVSIEQFEQMVNSLEFWEAKLLEMEAEIRQLEIKMGDVLPVSATELFNSKEKDEIKAAIDIDISDDDLFA